MRVYLHSENAERSKAYTLTVAPAADTGFVVGEVPTTWKHPDGQAKQIEIVFAQGAAEVDDQLAVYLIKRGIAHRSRMLRKVKQFFDRNGRAIDEVFDERGTLVLFESDTRASA
jgi:hypothetical protein